MSNVDPNTITIGSFEHVSFPLMKIENVIAKVDTGAYSGAVHCSSVRVVKRKSDGKRVLRYVPSDNTELTLEADNFTEIEVKSSNGHQVKRYLIETEIILRDKPYTVRIGLANRSKMDREVLIGRRFLRENNILVDVRINQDLDNDNKGKA